MTHRRKLSTEAAKKRKTLGGATRALAVALAALLAVGPAAAHASSSAAVAGRARITAASPQPADPHSDDRASRPENSRQGVSNFFGDSHQGKNPPKPAIAPGNFRVCTTGLQWVLGSYYFGARYYDPRTSIWVSPDPILASYMAGEVNGGVYVPRHLGLYTYTLNNPVIFRDPDGLAEEMAARAGAALGRYLAGAPQFERRDVPVGASLVPILGPGANLSADIESGHFDLALLDATLLVLDIVTWGAASRVRAASVLSAEARNVGRAGVGQALQADAGAGVGGARRFTPEQQGLVDMAKKDKAAGGVTPGDMEAYKQLNAEAGSKGFTTPGAVRGPEIHPPRTPHAKPGPGQKPHGHVGPVNHIPVKLDR